MSNAWSALVNGAILSALLTAAVWLAHRIAPRRVLNATTRYVVWWATLAVTLALPLLFWHVDSPPPPIVILPASPVVFEQPAPADVVLSEPSAQAPSPTPHLHFPSFPVAIPAGPWLRWGLACWMLASAFLMSRLAISYALLDRRRARAWAAPARLRARSERWLEICGTARRVRLAGSAEIATPVAVGPRCPSILMPARMLTSLDDDDLDRVGLHEAAHLARRDDYALLIQRILEALFALHPVVRWITRQIDLEREVACDDFVVEALGRARSYADCLTRMVELCGCVRPSLASANVAADLSHLARRVEMLLDRTRNTGTRLLKLRLAAMFAALACMAWAAGRAPGFVDFAVPLARTIIHLPALVPQVVQPRQESAIVEPAARDFEGRVVEDSSGNPLASAELRFHRAGMRELAADLETDREGKFHAPGLPPGEYTVDVSKPNFVTAAFQLRVPASGLLLRLMRYGVIDGQANDTEGQPLPGRVLAPGGRTAGSARVVILVKPAGTEELRLFREAPMEDGHFRVHDLPPGQYAVGLWYAGLKMGAGMQLYPDNQHPRFFTIAGGEEYRDINFTVASHSGFQVSGKVELPKPGMKFALALGLPEQPTLPVAQTLAENDGSFHFENVPPGSYDLFAAGPVNGYGAYDNVLGSNRFFGRTRIQVGAVNVDGLAISVSGGRSLAVVLRPHVAGPPPAGCPPSATVALASLEPWGAMLNANLQVVFEKEQTARDLAPGRYRLTATSLGSGCYQVNQPVADLRGDVSGPVAIEVAAAGSIHGTLRAGSAAAVTLLEAEATDGAQARLAFPDGQGRFSFDGLPPGRYKLAAQVPKAAWKEVEVSGGAQASVELAVPSQGAQQ
jgi:beta-lactamase regulating signal transducer with metallopeptidase domain